jgi:hypothetical protein
MSDKKATQPAPTAGDAPQGGLPHFPEGYVNAIKVKERLPWSYVQERMTGARNYWITTATLEGKPSATPVWGVWIDDRLYFDGSPETRRGRNIAANSQVAVHLENGDQAVMLEGPAIILSGPPDRTLAERIAADYVKKYAADGYSPPPEQWDEGGLFVFTPRKVIAWTNFIKDATRWVFK